MTTYDTPNPIDLDVTVGIGDIDITASDRPDTFVEVMPSRPNRSGDISLAKEASVRFDGGRLVVFVPKRLNLFGPGDSVDVRVDLPTGSSATVVSAYGGIRARGTLGASDITASYGRVIAEKTGQLRLATPYGEVEIGTVDGNLELTAGHGRHRIERVSGDTHVRGSHGDIEFGELAGSVEVSTSGGVAIDHGRGNLDIRTAHGAIRIGRASGSSVRLENGHAEIEIGVPEGTAAWIDAASRMGIVRNELTPDSSPDGAERTIELRLRNNSGDILIHRAQPSRVG